MKVLDNYDQVIARLAKATYQERRRFVRKIVKPPYPHFLYRYIASDPAMDFQKWTSRVHDVLIQSRLWLSAPADFNDPFDMTGQVRIGSNGKIRREGIENIVKAHRPNLSWKSRRAEVQKIMARTAHNLPAVIQNSLDTNMAKVGVCSFSTDARNIQMWSHYGAQHRSVVLQFDVARDSQIFLRAVPVAYGDEYPIVEWFSDDKDNLRKVLLGKHLGWNTEHEWRIIEIDRARSYLSFEHQALTGLVLGCRADDNVRKTISALLKERAAIGAPPIKVYEAIKHPSRFKICVSKAR